MLRPEFTKTERCFYAASELLEDNWLVELSKLIHDSYSLTDWFKSDYPQRFEFYYGKCVPGLFTGEREIIVCYESGEPVATAVLKKTAKERKLCTLFVREGHQRRGIGTEMAERCFEWLGTRQPLLTIPDYKAEKFEKMIDRYGWRKTQILPHGYYNDEHREYVYNGSID